MYSSLGNASLVRDIENDTEYHYYYDNTGTIINEKVVKNEEISHSRFYEYDDEGRVINQKTYYSNGSNPISSITYEYNADGSVSKKTSVFTEESTKIVNIMIVG